MSFALPPTLMEVREAVAIRLNVGAQATVASSMRDLLDEFIRRASREVLLEAAWVELRVRLEMDLVDGVSLYEWPDNMDPGRLEGLSVVSQLDGNDERVYELHAGIRAHEQEMWTGDSAKGLPVRYEIINGDLRLLPAPDTENYQILRIEGYQRPPEPRTNTDRIPLDKEAVVQKAVAIGKQHFGHPDALLAANDFRLYVERMRPLQSDGEDMVLGGARSRKFSRTTLRRNPAWRESGYTYDYDIRQ